MKKLFSVLSVVVCLSAFAASDYCISNRDMDVGGAAILLSYDVFCDGGVVTKTKDVVVNFLLVPILGWNKRNEANFKALLEEFGQETVATLKVAPYKEHEKCESLVISSGQASSNNDFCIVSEVGTTQIGINNVETKHSYSVICNSSDEKVFNGVELDDLDAYMSDRGFDRVADFEELSTDQSRLLECAGHFDITAQYIYQK